jgi:GAF domain-containing protein
MENNDTETHEIPSTDQQLLDIKHQIDKIRVQLRQSDPDGLQEVMNDLAQISNRLTRLGYYINRNEEERKDLHALADIGGVVNSSVELDEVLRIVMDTFVSLTGAERGFLMLRDESGQMSIHIARNWEQESIDPADFAISSTVVNRTANEGKPILTTDAQEDPQFDVRESIIAHALRSILCVPLKVKDEITGVIYADNRIFSGIFTKTDRDLLAAFANQAAIAIENARLFESVLKTLAEVTELKNLTDNIFASIASGVITADDDTRITLCNRAAEEI